MNEKINKAKNQYKYDLQYYGKDHAQTQKSKKKLLTLMVKPDTQSQFKLPEYSSPKSKKKTNTKRGAKGRVVNIGKGSLR